MLHKEQIKMAKLYLLAAKLLSLWYSKQQFKYIEQLALDYPII